MNSDKSSIFHPEKPLYWQYLNHQFNLIFQTHHIRSSALIIGITAFFVALTVLLRMFIPQEDKVLGIQNQQPETVNSAVVIEPTKIPTPIPQPTTRSLSSPFIPVYYAQLSAKPNAANTSGLLLYDVIVDALIRNGQNNQQFRIKDIVYDTSEGDPISTASPAKFNFNYYLVVEGRLNTNTAYDSDLILMTLRPADNQVVPFVTNSQFCQTNNDCSLRNNMCAYDAFNRYQPFSDAYICTQTTDATGKPLTGFSQEQNCSAEKIFTSVSCQANRCIGNFEIICTEPT